MRNIWKGCVKSKGLYFDYFRYVRDNTFLTQNEAFYLIFTLCSPTLTTDTAVRMTNKCDSETLFYHSTFRSCNSCQF